MKPTLTLTIGKQATKKQIEKAFKKVYELSGEFAIMVLMEEGAPSLPEQEEVKDGEHHYNVRG